MDILGLTLTGSDGSTITFSSGDAGFAAGAVFLLMAFGFIIGLLIKMALTWGVLKKAGYRGWEGAVPFYGDYCLCKAAGVDTIFFILGIFINLIYIYVYIELAKKFSKDAIWGVGLYFLGLIFFPVLGYGQAKYNGKKVKR